MSINQVMPSAQNKSLQSDSTKHFSKGQKTREKILFSAIEVLALNGLKGTTHRAIANHAGIQLSLTTYYFKDIQELIHQAFKLNSEIMLSRSGGPFETSIIEMAKIKKGELKKVVTKKLFCEQLCKEASSYLLHNIKHHAVSIAVAQLMVTEAHLSPELRTLSQEHELSELAPYKQLCLFFNHVNPELDAKIMYTVFINLQYQQLANQVNTNYAVIDQTIQRLFGWIMGLK